MKRKFLLLCLIGIGATGQAMAQNQTVTNGSATSPVNFNGNGCMYSWTNNQPSIGLPASGMGNIASFTAINNSSLPIVATITAKPVPTVFAYIPNVQDNTVSVVNTVSNSVVATIPVGSDPGWVSVTPDGSKVYISNVTSNDVSVISTATNTVIATIPMGNIPQGIVVNHAGTTAYVNTGGGVKVIDVATNTITGTLGGPGNLVAIAIDPSDKYLYTANYNAPGSLEQFDIADNLLTFNVPVANSPYGLAITPDGSRVYATGAQGSTIAAIDVATQLTLAIIPVGFNPQAAAVSPDGNTVYVSSSGAGTITVINTATNTVTGTITAGAGASGINVSADGTIVYVCAANSLIAISTATQTILSTVPVGNIPLAGGNFLTPPSNCNSPTVTFTITVAPTSNLTAGAATGNISACQGTPSAAPSIQESTISGTGIAGNITATAPTGFEVSLSLTGGFGDSVILVPAGGIIDNLVIYVRSAASAPAGTISGNVVLTEGGLTQQTIPVTGFINTIPTVDQAPDEVVPNGMPTIAVNFTGSGNTFTWVNNTPGIGLAATGTGNIASFPAVNNGLTPIVATISVTPQDAGFSCPGKSMNFTITIDPTLPAISVTGPLSPMKTVYGTSSTVQTFTISGTYLAAGMLVTPPAGFVVSTDGANFSPTVTIGTNVAVIPTTIYIQLPASTPAGSYSGNIVISSGAAAQNLVVPVSTVTPAPLTIIAQDTSRPYGQENPVFTFAYSGFQNNETEAQLITPPQGSTAAMLLSPVGDYPITPAGAEDSNYMFAYLPGTLKITLKGVFVSIPNAFTPNGDGRNDTWGIKDLAAFTNCKVAIYDRYGQLVFTSTGYGTPWNGTQNGKNVPAGVYVYIIDLGNGTSPMKGTVIVIR